MSHPTELLTAAQIAARVDLERDVCDYPRLQKRLYMNGAEEAVVDLVNIRIEGAV